MADQKYQIIQKLDSGGMAEVWKGKASSIRGFEKLVAIKRVLPALSKNKKFISMFLDEARLSLYLNHANIVQTFDIGMSANAYFIVMEWVDGANLRSILETCQGLGFRVPVEQAVFIATEVCKGLSHAHSRKDPKNRPLNIVHRDISPPNILLSRDGEIKIVDFGLAKAASQITSTDPGIVKGKFSYLSPEAAHGRKVDGRADVFAVGTVLYEMLAGRKLFQGETDLKTVELVRRTRIPPIQHYNPGVGDDLNEVLLKSLARDPRDRYQSAEALGHALSKYLFSNRLMVTNYDIATLVKRVLATKEQEGDVTKVFSLEDAAQDDLLDDFTSLEDLDTLSRMEFKSVLESPGGDDSGLIGPGIDPRGWVDELSTRGPQQAEAEETILDGSMDDLADETIVQSPEELMRVFGTGAADLVEDPASLPPATPGPDTSIRVKRTPVQQTPPKTPGPAARPQAKAPAQASAGQAARPGVKPADLSSPTGPHPMARQRPGFPLAAGVILGVVGIAALGLAVWFLTTG